jgi:hypothetical protein
MTSAALKQLEQLPPVICPKCGREAFGHVTSYGIRHACCELHSWGGKPLVSQAVHDARQEFHKAFDRLWKTADRIYVLKEPAGSPQYRRACQRIRLSARDRAYRYIAEVTGLPEPECHGAAQTDIDKLRRLTEAALACAGPEVVRNRLSGEIQTLDAEIAALESARDQIDRGRSVRSALAASE